MIDPTASQKPKPLKSTRLFSLQLADHDAVFAPRAPRTNRFWWLKILIYFPAAAFLILPSFKIGQAVVKNPGYTIPDSLHTGEVFTLPVDEEEEILPQIAGQSLTEIEAKKPLYLGVAGKSDFDVTFAWLHPDRPKLKTIIEKLKHPEFSMFVKRVHVIAPEAPIPDALLGDEEPHARGRAHAKIPKEPGPRFPTPIVARETKAYGRTDGTARLRCWKQPAVEPIGVDPLKPRRMVRLGSVSASGPGEVVYSGSTEVAGAKETVVVLYHGGGLYSRYWGLRDSRVREGTRVAGGSSIGYASLAPTPVTAVPVVSTLPALKEGSVPATWTPFLMSTGNPMELKVPSLLALSSQLCETK